MKVLNKTARVIFVDGVMLVPARATYIKDFDRLMKKVPSFAEMVEKGDIIKLSEEKAREVERNFEQENLDTLKKAAKEKGLDTSKSRTRQDYINLLKG